MEQYSCVGPVFRRVELGNSKESRQSRCDRSSSRASSTDSIRRSLTPTRITQPIPRPWTATVTSGTNLFQSSYKSQQEHICGNYCGKEVCQREKVCQREQSLEREISQTIYKRESPCERHQPTPPEHQHQEQHVHSEKESCTTEGNIHQREHKTSQVCRFICESKVEPQKLEYEVQRKPSIDLSKLVPSDVAICPKGIDGEHDLYTETEEEDKGNLHIKKTTTYEKIVELVTPDQEIGLSFGKQEEQSQFVSEQFMQRSSTVDREVEDISGRKHLSASTETLTQKIDTQQLIEETRMREDKERKLKAEKEQRQREEEERKRQEECLLIEMRKKDEEKQIQRLKIESQRKAEEHRRLDEEAAEKSSDQTIYSTQRSEIIEKKYQCPNERINNVQLNDRPPSTERVIKIQMEDDQQSKTQITVVKEEMNIKKHCELKDYKQQRRKSLREQVEVHQSLRDQQIPERRQPTLQERRLCSRFSQQSEEQQQKSTDNWNSKKHVQFVKVRETEVCSVPQTPVKNSNPKEWQSDMCKSLSTTSDHRYSPLQSDGNMSFHGETRELHHHEVIYKQNSICRKCQPKLPPIPNRSVSPFVAALTTASDRPYSPLGRDVNAEKAICRCQSQTPEMKTTYEGYSAPSQILYRGKPKEPPKKSEGPRPLPTPPLDFRFRNRSASPCYSRSQTPSGRVSSCGLKKPDTIPQYQKCLVCEEQSLVQGHDYSSSSRTPTPGCCKSPISDPLETPTYFIRAPRIRDDPPPCKRSNQRDITTPNKTETVQYHYEEDTPKIHKNQNTICSKTVSWLGEGIHKHAHIQEHNDTVTEECDGSHHITKMEHKLKEYDESEQPSISPVENDNCYISQNSDNQPTLQCPKIQNSILDKIQKTGIRVFAPMGAPEVRRIRHDIPPLLPKLPCPMTGVTVLPIKAHGDTTCKSGVVIVPCDGIGMSGVCITPTPDRLDVSVSPCLAQAGGICKKPSCYCGSTSGNCTTSLGNDKTTHSVDASICTGIAGVRSVQYPKPILKCLSAEKAKLPFPQIPHPEEQSNQYSNQGCPRSATNASSTSTSFSSNSESRDCGFQPIHKPQPRTNLCNQITTLTLCKRESQAVVTPTPQVPRVKLYKPQSQSAQLPSCRSNTTKIKCQSIYNQNRFRRETQTICETQSRTQSQIQTQTSCLANKIQNSVDPPNLSSHPDLGSGASGFGGNKGGTFAGSSAPNRGKGILNQAGSGLRVPLCAACDSHVRY
ncbi:PREDICTED: uncharacterized protein LOC105366320 [Ceratosolen solmsi marchali]|uniref:Uncharacterized protein LOC105366320 n=1 Tax=Ceratosolen solmsi marchali TaxID=326594 RepID=A0AAJ6YRS3_9HYME|nr:PREDICTED: uncharacterized protein LOC105366320 [Ceratosolen solmsi marchali]